MNKLPSKSLSKSILIAIPLFCFVIAILDTSDELSYLFILQFLGNMAGTQDITFLPTQQPEIGNEYQKYQYFQYHGIDLMENSESSTHIPLISKNMVEEWAQKYEIIKGVSPRWLIPIVVNRTDSLILVANVSNELNLGIGLKSNLQKLGEREIAISNELLSKLSKKVGDKISVTISISDLFNGRKLIEKYQSTMSRNERSLIVEQQLRIEQLSHYIYTFISERSKPYNITIQQNEIKQLVEYIYNLDFSIDYTIKYQYKNSGLYSSSLNNVVLMEFQGFSRLLSSFVKQNILKSKQLQKILFEQLDKTKLSSTEKATIKTYFKLAKNTETYQEQLQNSIKEVVQENPLMMVAAYNHRELVYHPSGMETSSMYTAMMSSPGDYQVVSLYPFFQQLDGIRYFFKSVIQIFTFVCVVIFFYTMRLILKQIYEQKEIEVGIWRTLGAGGVHQKQGEKNAQSIPLNKSKLKGALSLKQKLKYGYEMLVKVGFLYYWLFSCLASVILYQLVKIVLYSTIADIFKTEAPPPQYLASPVIWFLLIFGFVITLVILHIREIYINPLVSTIKPVKRTFDLVKVRVIKIATFGITLEILIIGIMLVYYGVVSYYWIPLSILEDDGDMQTLLFNSIFVFMILGSIMVLTVMQSRMECWMLNILFYFNKHLSTLKLIMLKSIKAKQYKNLKVSLIISLIFSFLLFFTTGVNIELQIVQSFSERQIGADLMILNYDKGLNRTIIQEYLRTIKDVKFTWISNMINKDELPMAFESFTKKGLTHSRIQIILSNYLDIAYYQYYYPEKYYEQEINKLSTLPNGVMNGFSSLYKQDGIYNNISSGQYNPSDTITSFDPHGINVPGSASFSNKIKKIPEIPQQEQIINLVVSKQVRKRVGASPGDELRLSVNNTLTGRQYFFRCKIMHSYKVSPTLDIYSDYTFLSEAQGNYIYKAVDFDLSKIQYAKVLITGVPNLQQIGNKIMSMSPDHTVVQDIKQVKLTFMLIENYLSGFVLFITLILAVLSVLFLAVYTYGKCKEEAEVFKMLRSIGLSVFDIRLMIFLEILIRMLISIVNGILLGIMFSRGLSGQVQQILMLKAPLPKLDIVFLIAFALLVIFSITVIKSTNYLTKRTVLQTSKL